MSARYAELQLLEWHDEELRSLDTNVTMLPSQLLKLLCEIGKNRYPAAIDAKFRPGDPAWPKIEHRLGYMWSPN